MESDQIIAKAGVKYRLSIHALRMESDAFSSQTTTSYAPFYPRSPHGERRDRHSNRTVYGRAFYPRSPHGERLGVPSISFPARSFYPRSPHGERHWKPYFWVLPPHFLSTLSAWRATSVFCLLVLRCSSFYPRSPHGERLHLLRHQLNALAFYPRSPHGERRKGLFLFIHRKNFLSTLSAWRATFTPMHIRMPYSLSIHALRMESDFSPCVQNEDNTELSIHALRMESDVCVCVCFLSTLSAWRATTTPPTRTKSIRAFYPRSPHGERPRQDYPIKS